jgi:hypothetical protein
MQAGRRSSPFVPLSLVLSVCLVIFGVVSLSGCGDTDTAETAASTARSTSTTMPSTTTTAGPEVRAGEWYGGCELGLLMLEVSADGRAITHVVVLGLGGHESTERIAIAEDGSFEFLRGDHPASHASIRGTFSEDGQYASGLYECTLPSESQVDWEIDRSDSPMLTPGIDEAFEVLGEEVRIASVNLDASITPPDGMAVAAGETVLKVELQGGSGSYYLLLGVQQSLLKLWTTDDAGVERGGWLGQIELADVGDYIAASMTLYFAVPQNPESLFLHFTGGTTLDLTPLLS